MAEYKDTVLPDALVVCPYDSNHRVKPGKIHLHVARCGKSRKNDDLILCPYNALHRIRDFEYQQHLCNCPDSRNVATELANGKNYYDDINVQSAAIVNPKMDRPPPVARIPIEEEWNDDVSKLTESHETTNRFVFGKRIMERSCDSIATVNQDEATGSTETIESHFRQPKPMNRARGMMFSRSHN